MEQQRHKPSLKMLLLKACASSPFTILCDGGYDQDVRKYFAIMVRFWDESAHSAISQFLAIPVCNVATAQVMFDVLYKKLECHKSPWSNMIGYTSDTASVMVGKINSVLSRIKEKKPKTIQSWLHLPSCCSMCYRRQKTTTSSIN